MKTPKGFSDLLLYAAYGDVQGPTCPEGHTSNTAGKCGQPYCKHYGEGPEHVKPEVKNEK